MAMYVLPAQASAVPYEQSVFFKQRNLLSPMQHDLPRGSWGSASAEILVQENHLSFVDDLMLPEEGYTILGQATETAFGELYKVGKERFDSEHKILILKVILSKYYMMYLYSWDRSLISIQLKDLFTIFVSSSNNKQKFFICQIICQWIRSSAQLSIVGEM